MEEFSQTKWERVVALEQATFLSRRSLLDDYTEFRRFAGVDDVLQVGGGRGALSEVLLVTA